VAVKLRVERAKPMMDEKVDKPKSKHFYGLFGLVFTWLVSGLLGVYVSQGIYEEMARESDKIKCNLICSTFLGNKLIQDFYFSH